MIQNNFQSLASRLSLWIIPLSAAILIAVLSANYFLSRFLIEEYVRDLAKAKASSTVGKIETIFNAASTNADSLAAVISANDYTEEQIHQTIKAFLKTDIDIFGMAVALEPHSLIETAADFSPYYYRTGDAFAYADLADSNYQYKNRAWYSDPKKLNTAVWAEPYLDEGGGNVLMTTYSTPIYLRDDKTFAGIATADIQLSWLDELIKEIKIGKSGFGFILSKNDMVIAHPDSSLNMKILDHAEVRPENWKKYTESKTNSSSVYLYTPCRLSNGFCWLAIETLGNTGWKVIIVLPEQELIAKVNSLTTKISIIAILGLLLLFIVISLVTRNLTKPLSNLARATKDIGAGYLDAELPGATRKDEIGTLTDDFSVMRNDLIKYIAEVKASTIKQQKLESEIQIAKDIQMSMIPGSGNAFIKENNFQLFALLRPARTVGGDLYYFLQANEVLHFIVGDVSDKGVPAALFMAKTVTLYTQALRDKLTPGQTLTMMNDLLADNNDACMFVTALCGSLNLKTGYMVMANAGHMNPVIQNPQETREFEIDGAIALGLMDGVKYPDVNFQLNNQTSLTMYTDGISEAHDTNNNQYSDEKLIALIAGIKSSNTEETGNKIIESVDNFSAGTEQFDDITLLIIQYE